MIGSYDFISLILFCLISIIHPQISNVTSSAEFSSKREFFLNYKPMCKEHILKVVTCKVCNKDENFERMCIWNNSSIPFYKILLNKVVNRYQLFILKKLYDGHWMDICSLTYVKFVKNDKFSLSKITFLRSMKQIVNTF